jgi:hypothetical protein
MNQGIEHISAAMFRSIGGLYAVKSFGRRMYSIVFLEV